MILWSNTSTLIQLKTFLGKIPRRGQFNLVVSGSYDNIWLGEKNFLETYSVVRGCEASEGEQNLIKSEYLHHSRSIFFVWELQKMMVNLCADKRMEGDVAEKTATWGWVGGGTAQPREQRSLRLQDALRPRTVSATLFDCFPSVHCRGLGGSALSRALCL